jgi:ATP-binding cassette subfamily F protein uup
MALLTLTDVAKTYDANRPLFSGVSLTVRDEDRIGLIGSNGAGKSTLLRILAGQETPDAGERVMRRGTRVGVLEQEPTFEPGHTVREIVRAALEGRDELLAALEEVHAELAAPELGADEMARLLKRQERLQNQLDELGGHDVEHLVEATIDGVGLAEPDAVCGTLSGGEARRTALARLLVASPDLMLLDEPTNHLDAFVIAWLEARLERLKVPLVLVTHDRYLLDRVADRIVELDRGSLYAYQGGYSHYVEERAARLAREGQAERTRLNLLRRETAWMRRGPPARTGKAKARVSRYEALVDDAPTPTPDELELAFPPGPRLGARVVSITGVKHAFDGVQVLGGLDLELAQGMRLGVIGPNGAGKTTLLRVLLGRLSPDAGEVAVGETVRFAEVDQRRSDLDPENTVVQEVAGANDHVSVGGRSIHVAGFLDGFLFPGRKKDVLIRSLSGGERGRVLLAKLMLQDGNVLVLDEPTNDLDLATLRALEEALCAYPGSVVVVSHDRWFLDRVATHVLHLDGKGAARLHTGGATDLLERIVQAEAPAPESRKKAARPAAAPVGPKKLTYMEQRELEELGGRIEALESALAKLDEQLNDASLYEGDGKRARDVQDQRTRASTTLDDALARWEELAERDAG